MSDGIKVLKKIGTIAGKIGGAALGFAVGGIPGAVVGFKAGEIGSKAIIGGTSKVLGIKSQSGDVQKQGSTPTLDAAAANQQVADRLKMRRGVLQNIYGGGSAQAAPSVGTKTLLGS